ncbi:MAG: DUF427 domain-containing protein [Rhodospirillaceae bacterium]
MTLIEVRLDTAARVRNDMANDARLEKRWQSNAAAQRARFAAYKLNPEHTISLHPHDGVIRILWNGDVIAESDHAIALHERKHDPVYYIPKEDVRTNLLVRTDHATHCPYKGDACYWSLVSEDKVAENAVWAYESPIVAMDEIAGLMAFYLDAMGKDFGLTIEIT